MHTYSFFFFFLQFKFVLFCVFFSFYFSSWYQFIFVSLNCWKFNFTYFSHNYDNYSMFRDVPECSMFRVLWTALRERARWPKSRDVIEPSCPLGTTRCIPQEKLPRKPFNKSFIDQVCSVKMAGYWPRSFFCEFIDVDFVSVHKHAKKGQYPAILTSHLVNNPYFMKLTIGQLATVELGQ